MVATGQRYGLRVNSLVDERRDPTKSSYAAAHYLYDLFQIFGDWHLAIAAYNAGPGNIQKAITRAGGSHDYWEIYPYLPTETRGYVPAFIAANYMMTYYSLHNICPMSSRLPAQTDTVMVTKKIHLEQIAKVLNVDIEMLRALNPMYRHDIIPGNTEPYALRLPLSDVNRYIENEDAICNYRANELLTNRTIVEVNDYTPTYYHKSKRSYKKGRKGRIGRHSKARRGGKKAATRGKARASKGKNKAKGRKSSRRRRR
jgi:membrane-bound lytic murein transglycosylase D